MCNCKNEDFIDKYGYLFLMKQPDQKFSSLVAPMSNQKKVRLEAIS